MEREIIDRIADFFAGEASENELEWLDRWVAESPANERFFREHLKLCYGVRFSGRVAATRKSATRPAIRRGVRRGAVVLAMAAVLAGVLLWARRPRVEEHELLPRTTYAMLLTTDGRSIDLDERSRVQVGSGVVSVDERRFEGESVRLVVPRGGQYELLLDDGTRVWLNSDSELRFPPDFEGASRRVTLRGEAFFDVTKNSARPFVVELSQGEIEVYGTRFYVSDYADRSLSAVLVEGSIALTSERGARTMLQPSQRAVLDRATGEIEVSEIDTRQYTSWLRDRFVFNGQTLGEIAQTLSRWYDVDIVFASRELEEMTLSGQLGRHNDIRVLLDAYRDIAGIDYSVEGRTITITWQKF